MWPMNYRSNLDLLFAGGREDLLLNPQPFNSSPVEFFQGSHNSSLLARPGRPIDEKMWKIATVYLNCGRNFIALK